MLFTFECQALLDVSKGVPRTLSPCWVGGSVQSPTHTAVSASPRNAAMPGGSSPAAFQTRVLRLLSSMRAWAHNARWYALIRSGVAMIYRCRRGTQRWPPRPAVAPAPLQAQGVEPARMPSADLLVHRPQLARCCGKPLAHQSMCRCWRHRRTAERMGGAAGAQGGHAGPPASIACRET